MKILFIILGILLLNLIILAHEWGHYFSAKSFGVKVNEFALGMGPTLCKIKKGETTFSLRALPLGGFCSMEGEDEQSSDPRAFERKKPWQKIIIVSMGAIMNIVLGFLITLIVFAQRTQFTSTTISKFSENAISQQSGLKVGDEILKIDRTSIFTYKDLAFALSVDGKQNFDFKIKRDSEIIELKDVKFNVLDLENGKSATQIDFYVSPVEKNFFSLIKNVFLDTISTIQIVWSGIVGLLTGRFALSGMSGPIGIVSAIGQATSEGLKTSAVVGLNSLLSFIAMITINLGVFNLLPLPALDGGRLIFLLFELITNKKLNPKYEGWIHAIGFALFIILMLFISYSDIMRLIVKN